MPEQTRLPGHLRDLLSPDFFRSLSDPVRLQVVARLLCSAHPLTVTEVQGCCGVHLSGVSRHLSALKTAGVAQATKVGREVRYSLRTADVSARLRALADAIDEVARAARTRATTENNCCAPGSSQSPTTSTE